VFKKNSREMGGGGGSLITEDVLPQNPEIFYKPKVCLRFEYSNWGGSEGEDEIPSFVKQVKMNLINRHVGTSQVSLPSGIPTFEF
jgi:hypothetical protein